MGIRDFTNVLREISFDDLEAEARIPPRILVISSRLQLASETSYTVFGADVGRIRDVREFDDGDVDPLHYDVIRPSDP